MPEWLRQRAYLSPEKIALIAVGTAGSETWTFRRLDDLATQLAQRLGSLGINAGDRVALLMRNSAQYVALVHAISRIGAILLPLNIRLKPNETGWQLGDGQARLLIHDHHNTANAVEATRSLPELQRVDVMTLFSAESITQFKRRTDRLTLLADNVQFDKVHSIIYTSGTTGRPKGAMLTYGNHYWSAVSSALNLGLHENDRWLAVLPLFHVGGLSILLRSVIYGMTLVLHESFDPEAVNRAIDEQGITIISAVSQMLTRMLEQRGDRPYPSSLRCVLLGGGPAPKPLLEACVARNIPVVQTYGLTEAASQVVTLAPGDSLRKLGSAGKPLFSNRLRIEREGVELTTPHEVGEIVVRGPTITPGYWERPEASAQVLQGGWLHTGDLGYLDSEGYLYVLDRRDDLIISGGENIYPAEVEAALLAHPEVVEAGVIGMPDEKWGQVPVAAVKVRNPVTEETLKTFVAERLAPYKVPTKIFFLDALPRNAAGKLMRRVLADSWR